MIKNYALALLLPFFSILAFGQNGATQITDSTTSAAHPSYEDVTKMHRFLFGENYRKEWAAETRFPVIKISEFNGGLTPTERGGGHQTHSIRLKDKDGKEWVLRSVEKYPEALLPDALKQTFAKDWLDDNMSAQHPYSALIVPPLAEAVHVPHTNPVIGWVYPDKALGEFLKDFANTLCLLEEREPMGDSDNTDKMLSKVLDDNDNKIDSAAFFRARILDLLVADWDRHEDQWRWSDQKKGDGKNYLAIPRDRDDVLFVNQGLLPKTAAGTHFLGFLQGFSGKIKDAPAFFYNGRKLDQQFLNQFNYAQWMKMTHDFVGLLPDATLEAALRALPGSSNALRHDYLLKTLKERRDDLPRAMDDYYHFLNKIVDIHLSDKNELVNITDENAVDLNITISKISKEGKTKQVLFARTFTPDVTKEIRVFLAKGSDSTNISVSKSPIKLRLIGSGGEKTYFVTSSKKPVKIFDTDSSSFKGELNNVRLHISNDTLNTAIVGTNLYTYTDPTVALGYNWDDGVLLGIGVSAKHEGFRKLPYGSIQQLRILSALSIATFRVNYSGQWFKVFKNTDLVVNAQGFIPRNTINFFGRGNETVFNKTGDYKTFYRARFDLYQFDAALRFNIKKGVTFSGGPSLQFYHYDMSKNTGRLISNPAALHSDDSLDIDKNKIHIGLAFNYENDHRDSRLLPTKGFYFNLKFQGYNGLNSFSRSFAQVYPEMAFFGRLDKKGTIVLADRIGGGATIGKTTFYQSVFLGGQDNLLGYRKYRFAGDHALYNNFELRLRLKNVNSYFIPGQLGLVAFDDLGRVWQKGERSDKWHNGIGGGAYYAPIQKAVVKVVAGHSDEGWYPYVNIGFRY